MTERAAQQGFETFVDDAIEITREQFSISRALTGTRGVSGSIIDRAVQNSETFDRRVVGPELATYRDRIVGQFEVVLEYATDPNPDEAAYRNRILDRDAYLDALREKIAPDRQAEIEDRLVARQLRLGDAVRPLVESDREEFWPAVRDAFDHDEAMRFVDEQFRFAGPLRTDADAFRFTATFDPDTVVDGSLASALTSGMPSVTVEFTDEAVRSITRAETTVVERAKRRVDRRF